MTNSLKGKRILVVEDEYYIASDLSVALRAAGAEVVGPTGRLSQGLALLDGAPVDAAVLDVNLEGQFTYRIADALIARSVPYLFVTGYDDWSLPDAYRAVPLITKPFRTDAVIAAVARLMERQA